MIETDKDGLDNTPVRSELEFKHAYVCLNRTTRNFVNKSILCHFYHFS